MLAFSLSALVAAASLASAATYKVTDTFIGSSFLTGFVHEAIADPTHVVYVDASTAQRLNLTYASSNSHPSLGLYDDSALAVQAATLCASGASNGRRTSRSWMFATCLKDVALGQRTGRNVGDNWPANGEVDIIEGVNNQSPNAATLHTTSGCTQPATRDQTGTTTGTDCNWQVNGNAGCGVKAPTTNSYGPAFNANGGGWYVMERTTTYIKVWFWPRNSATVPAVVKSGASSIDTSTFGTPFASFVNSSCDIASHFGPENIVINLTFCGDWAGNADVYRGSGCPSTCVDYVNNNPSAFKNAYWDIAALRVYQ
ncbi:glycoside hydrolase family 16 protein [Ceratobasidium sp. AG-Ba]|nr:glycoside hydrolase family 16 protein [Ceratobasidium sp. AG-Ba]